MPGVIKGKATVARDGGDITIELTARGAVPLEGVLANMKGQLIKPNARTDPSVISWTLNIETTNGFVFYGIATPLGRTLLAPQYERRILQNGEPVKGVAATPLRKTRKINRGEWVGPPEAIRLVKKGGAA